MTHHTCQKFKLSLRLDVREVGGGGRLARRHSGRPRTNDGWTDRVLPAPCAL